MNNQSICPVSAAELRHNNADRYHAPSSVDAENEVMEDIHVGLESLYSDEILASINNDFLTDAIGTLELMEAKRADAFKELRANGWSESGRKALIEKHKAAEKDALYETVQRFRTQIAREYADTITGEA